VIARNTPLPASRTDSYFTLVDDQPGWEVCVYQGDDPDAMNNVLVGRFLIEGLSAVPAGNEVLCRMDLDLDGILRVTATEKRTGLAKHIAIERATTAMTGEEVAEARRRMQRLFADAGDLEADGVDEDDLEDEWHRAADDEADLDADAQLDVEPAVGAADRPGATGGSPPRRPAGDERERRVSISEARALVERARRLHERMSAEDRADAVALADTIDKAIGAADWERLSAARADLADLLFYVEEG
jgi:molecular chaperone DnaK